MSDPRLTQIRRSFRSVFDREAAAVARAPGRVEFIGNHTDYNGGSVLGAAIDRYIWTAAGAEPGGRRRMYSELTRECVEWPAGEEMPKGPEWARYPAAVWRSLADFGLPRPSGFSLWIGSSLPPGAGLSSSAALELATALALAQLGGGGSIEPARLAALGRHAENHHVGVPCGILDQGTSAFGAEGALVHIDCLAPAFRRVPLPASARLWVFESGQRHSLLDGLYAERHRECAEAAALLGVPWLALATPRQLAENAERLPPVLARRARHVVEENGRVAEMVPALEAGDLHTAGRLLVRSHWSSRHLFENSTPLLDQLVERLERHPRAWGARLTGGGFGGAVMALTDESFSQADALEVAAASPRGGAFLSLRAAPGACLVS